MVVMVTTENDLSVFDDNIISIKMSIFVIHLKYFLKKPIID